MVNETSLPAVRTLLALAQETTFPISAGQLADIAEKQGYDDRILAFLRRFYRDEEFVSKAEFMTRSEEVEMFLEQELTTPMERTRSPDD